MVCLAGQMISGKVIELHSAILQMVLALAFFIPIIMDMGGQYRLTVIYSNG
jgi:magnesium transporter